MDDELKDSRVSVLIHAAVGAAIGLLSYVLGVALYAVALMVLAAIIMGHLTERVVGKKKFSWWIGNGLFIYIFVWLDVWIFLANYV